MAFRSNLIIAWAYFWRVSKSFRYGIGRLFLAMDFVHIIPQSELEASHSS